MVPDNDRIVERAQSDRACSNRLQPRAIGAVGAGAITSVAGCIAFFDEPDTDDDEALLYADLDEGYVLTCTGRPGDDFPIDTDT